MSLTDVSSRPTLKSRLGRISKNTWVISIALIVYAALSTAILVHFQAVPRFRIDLSPLLNAGTAILVHVSAAVVTLLVGTVLMFAPKGFRLHRTLGWTWVIAMALTAGSSFFITMIFETHFSPIHALSAWTMIGLPMGIAAIRRKDVARHRKEMTGMFVGAMLVAGLFSLLPGRLMWDVFFAT
ncbi:MAG: DUF2306 domain-containing protein [Henriciella sp.]|uniref:DUF2306 domain-containing protein n=1 Tax=Henriciella sp. TaxID=1968823 RepID=UPI0032EC1B0F